ncbi:MAG: hypothetical protein JWO82_2087 [Akkermansiaceae bacterium]|nr:hypothetical protein [Akkermansiaceae bacterium]
MKLILLLLAPVWLVSNALAHNYEPLLLPIATAHRAKILKLAEKRDTTTRGARDTYLVILESEQKEASNKGDTKLMEKLTAEIDAVKLDGFTTSPDGFSRKLLSARKTLEKAIQQAQSDAEREAKPVNASYLSDLNRLSVGEGSTPLLVKQIASEKKALSYGFIGPIFNPETDLPGTAWWPTDHPNESWKFSYADGEVHLDNWKVVFPKPDELVIQWQGNWFFGKILKNGRVIIEGGRPKLILSTGKKE